MIYVISLLGIVILALSVLLVRATKRLLQFDDIWQGIHPVLVQYAADLQTMVRSEGLLLDHPEVIAFHKRNLNTLAEVERIVNRVTEVRPPKRDVKLPAPDVE